MLLDNEAGALSRVVGLFSARGYNIDALTVARTEDPTLSRATITTPDDARLTEQIIKQLNKLVDVVEVVKLSGDDHIERDTALVKIARGAGEARAAELASAHGAARLEETPRWSVYELTAATDTVDAFVRDLADARPAVKILEVARSGAVGMGRDAARPQTTEEQA